MRNILLAAAALPLLATAAAAQQGPETKAKSDADKIVCKSESFTGSHVRKRICKTKAQWEQAAEDAQDALDMSRKRRTEPPRYGG